MLNDNQSQLLYSAASLYKKCCNSADGFPSGASLKVEVRRERKKRRRKKSEVEEGRDRRSIDRNQKRSMEADVKELLHSRPSSPT